MVRMRRRSLKGIAQSVDARSCGGKDGDAHKKHRLKFRDGEGKDACGHPWRPGWQEESALRNIFFWGKNQKAGADSSGTGESSRMPSEVSRIQGVSSLGGGEGMSRLARPQRGKKKKEDQQGIGRPGWRGVIHHKRRKRGARITEGESPDSIVRA